MFFTVRPVCRLVLLLSLAASSAARAETFYVAPGGDDDNSGLQGMPWATLQHAADVVDPGDLVVVNAGNYTGFYLERSGNAQAPITFRADPGVFITEDNETTPDGINLEGASFVVVEGFNVNGRTRAGIRAVLCEHVTIRGNKADSNGVWGILTGFCDDLLIEGNEMSRSMDEHGIYVSNSGDRPIIRDNLIWGNRANGIHMNGDADQGGDGVISGAVVERNIIYDNGVGGGSGINCDGVQNSRIQNNLLFGNHASGISLYQIDGGQPSRNNLVINNTVLSASDGRWCLNIANGSTGATVYNNIFFNDHGFRGSISLDPASAIGFTSDRNVVMERFTMDGGSSILDLEEWRSATGQEQNSLLSTPAELFVDAAADDYHLSLTSPAVDAGTSTQAPFVDLEMRLRPAGPQWDIGAYERGAVPGTPAPSPTLLFTATATLTLTVLRTATRTPTRSPTPNQTPALTASATFTPTAASTAAPTGTPTPAGTATAPAPIPVPADHGRLGLLLGFLAVLLGRGLRAAPSGDS